MNLKAFDVARLCSPREAADILDCLDRLGDLLWELYSDDIIKLRQDEQGTETDSDNSTNRIGESQQAFEFEDTPDP